MDLSFSLCVAGGGCPPGGARLLGRLRLLEIEITQYVVGTV